MNRRNLLKVGMLGAFGLSDLLRATHAAQAPSRATSAIWIHLGGGPSHMDTFDLKPDAPAAVRGEFNPIATNVNGIQISEHLPHLARCADKYTILRGVSHTLAGHELGTEYVNTGSRPVPSIQYPGVGAVVSKELTGDRDLPHFVAIPSTPQRAGYLGVRHAPLQTNATPVQNQPFSVRGISLVDGLTVAQFENRQRLLNDLDTTFQDVQSSSRLVDGLDRFAQQAHAMITSPRARQAFDVSKETPAVAQSFGAHRFGMSCLLAMRLIEAGVKYATISYSGWDTHGGNFNALKNGLLPSLDQGLSALLNGLAARGLLEKTAVCVTGEFGRTPKINDKAGRDHWPRAYCVILAGGSMRVGQVLGASDAQGGGPATTAITPDQVVASFFQTLGIDYRKEYHTATGRPITIVREGGIIPGLLA